MTETRTTGTPTPMTKATSATRKVRFPAVHHRLAENSFAALLRHSLIHCKRLLFMWLRDSTTTVQAILYPALTLLMFWVVLGEQITNATRNGAPSVFGTTAMITLIAAMTGSLVSAIGLHAEASSGLLARFATLPIHRASGLIGRMLAEAIRMTITTVVIITVGVVLGFRFHQGPVAALALLTIPVIFGMAFAMFVTTLGTVKTKAPLVDIVSIVVTLLMFFNTGFVPVFAYPVWLQDTVANQPMSCAIDAMKGLSFGGPVAEPLLKTIIWSVGIMAIFALPAIRGYSRAANEGP